MAVRVLLTGAGGYLGAYLHEALEGDSLDTATWQGRSQVDLQAPDQLRRSLQEVQPAVVVHAAAVSRPALAVADPQLAAAVNTRATQIIAESVPRVVYLSTDMVFDGERGRYRETDVAAPTSVYGRTKLAAESAVLEQGGVVLRLSLLYGPARGGRVSFFDEQVAALRAGRRLRLFEDEWRTPLSVAVAAEAVAEFCRSELAGLFHLGGPQRLSRLEMGRRLARFLGVSDTTIEPCSRASVASSEARPRDLSLDSSKWRAACPEISWPDFETGLRQMM